MENYYFTTGICATTAVAAATAVYFLNNNKLYPETSRENFDKQKKHPSYESIMMTEGDSYDISIEDGFEVCWDNDKDVSEWKFSDGGYFITENKVILPSNEWQTINGLECIWVPARVPIKLCVTKKKVIKKSVK